MFSWRNGNAELLYVRDSVWSNGALITDLNRNGRNELALTVGLVSGRTQFFEYAPGAYAAPIILDAYATPTAGIVCRWTSSPAARYYRLSVDGIIVAETSDTSIVLAAAAIPPCARCTLTVQAWGEADSSRRSLPAIVVRAEPLVLMQADTVYAGEKMLRVTTRGFLPANGIPPAALRVEKDGIRWNVQYTAANGLQELLAWLSQPLEEGSIESISIRVHWISSAILHLRRRFYCLFDPHSTILLVLHRAHCRSQRVWYYGSIQ